MNVAAKPLATVRNYKQLMAVFRSRVDELEITRETMDGEGKMPSGYSAKLLNPDASKSIGRNSLGALLGVLRLALVVVDDADGKPPLPKRLCARRPPR